MGQFGHAEGRPAAWAEEIGLTGTSTIWRHVLYRRCDFAHIISNAWIFSRQLVDIADFDVCRCYPRPLGARAQKPTTVPDQPRSVERIAGNQQLHALAAAQVRSHDYSLGGAIDV